MCPDAPQNNKRRERERKYKLFMISPLRSVGKNYGIFV